MAVRTYKGRTEEEQKEYNAKRRAYFKQLREKSIQGEATVDDETGDISIDINPIVPEIEQPKLSLKDRLLSKLSKDDTEESEIKSQEAKKHAANSYKLISHAIPMALSALAAIYAKRMFSEEYKKCAPTREEISTVLLPIFAIISRMIEIETKASQNAIDSAAAIMAAITVGTRMLMTAEEIKNAGNQQPNQTSSNNPVQGDASRDSEAKDNRIIRAYFGADGNDNRRGVSPGSDGNGNGPDGPIDDRTREAALVAQLLRRDTIGRRQLGYAPQSI